ncbi:hypothetical protein HK103_004018 [Boothiomyces macroporosus]|uniref:Steroid 5-alpha reductase C-terminal domain-containing protein n=1 Tax=Boothiomyces macroporosus TaxID=261099 RepID=A0AAD5Y8U7_9FUNG|nr:hypothetical protein HK103_004018 [Boothiomyces macroporosus]
MGLGPTPATSSIILTLIIDAGIQVFFYLISAALKTEKLYDLAGSLTYITCVIVAMANRNDGIAARQLIMGIFTLVWALRLGSYLFMRVLKHSDSRFADLKKSPIKFAIPWFLQIVWIYLTALPVFIILGNPSNSQQGLIWSDIVGIVLWAIGFLMEAVADAQKNKFKKEHPRDFITTGLFKYTRYPNYFGEVLLWFGMWVISCAGVAENWQWVSVVSPVFVYLLLVHGSGVALSEKGQKERYGERLDYQAYVARTSTFIPWFPKKQDS